MQIPGYHIERLVAEGGTSAVYRAVQASLDRPVALKVLKHIDSLQQAERFLREARIVAALEHRNIVTIHDVGSVEDRYYIAMEFLEGGSLADRIEHGLPAAQALELVEAVAGCLDFVHRRGVVHRDIKPGNILFHADGTPKLSDFGIAKELADDQEGTMDGSCLGSPYYLSPEQAEGRPLDGRSDIYSLGIVFYQMLTGRRPYAEGSHIETIVAHLSHPIPVLPERFARYQRLLEDMIAKDPADRIASAAALVERVRALRAAEAPTGALGPDGVVAAVASRAGRAHMPVALALLAAGAGIAWWLFDVGTEQSQGAVTAAVAVETVTVQPDMTPTPAAAPAAPIASHAPSAPERAQDLGTATSQVTAAAADELASGPASGASPGPETATATATATADSPERPAGDPPAHADAGPEEAATVETAETTAATAQVEDENKAQPVQAASDTAALHRDAARIDALMRQAKADLAALRLTRPAGNSAQDRYRQVLALEPGHAGALAGIDAIAARYAALAEQAAAEGDLERAGLYLRRGRQVQPDHPDLAAAELAMAPPPEPRLAVAPTVVEAPEAPQAESLRGQGSGNIVKDFGKLWRSVFD
jgi:serine/threonine-protein kinase PpkA